MAVQGLSKYVNEAPFEALVWDFEFWGLAVSKPLKPQTPKQ